MTKSQASMLWRGATAVCLSLAFSCSQKTGDPLGGDGSGAGTSGGSVDTSDPTMGASPGQGPAASDGNPAAGQQDTTPASGGSAGAGSASGAAGASTEPPPEVVEMLDPATDWTALTLIFPTMYSAYDGVHTFEVPVRVDGVNVDLSGWQAIPSSAVTFEADPDSGEGAVLVTVLEPVEDVTIAVSTGGLGGTAPLHITVATPADWDVGEARYHNGVEYEMPMINLVDLLDPNYMPPETPHDLACNNCHTTGAKYLEIQHTPSQVAYISDADLQTIFTKGMKPAGIGFSVLPPQLEYLYPEFHTWEASDQEILALIVYLRSLTPVSQGPIVIPDTVVLPMP